MKRIRLVSGLFLAVTVLIIFCACESSRNNKYRVLIVGGSDSSNALILPTEFSYPEEESTDRDKELWPEKMTVEFEGDLYDCSFYRVVGANGRLGYQYRFSESDSHMSGNVTLDEERRIVGFFSHSRIPENERQNQKLIKQSEAVEIAWEVAHRYFDIDNSSYYDEVYRTSPNSDRPELGWWDVYLMRRFTEKIEIQDYVLIRILPWGELQSFHGIALGSIVIPENPPDFDEVKECIETRFEDLLHKQKDKFTSPTIEIAHSVLYFDPKDDRYKITCFVNLECTKIVNDEEINVHDYIEVVVVLN